MVLGDMDIHHCEMAFYGISESLQHSNIKLPEETTQLFYYLQVGLRHALPSRVKRVQMQFLRGETL
jgi:hypothetical protein